MIRRKPELAVVQLLARLNKAKMRALGRSDSALGRSDKDNSLASKFKDIEGMLVGMKNSYPSIKSSLDKVTDEFCKLEQQLYEYHVIFEKNEDERHILNKLVELETNLEELKKMIREQFAKIDTSDKGNKTEQSARTGDEDDAAVSEEWKNLKIEEKISENEAMSSLLASFRSLESFQEKMCLMFLSVFPENSVIKKKPIIYWWIGEGVVTKKGAKTAEEVGEKVFHQLLNQGFIKQSNDDNNSSTVKTIIVGEKVLLNQVSIKQSNENNNPVKTTIIGEEVFQQLLNQGSIKQSNEDNNSNTVKTIILGEKVFQQLVNNSDNNSDTVKTINVGEKVFHRLPNQRFIKQSNEDNNSNTVKSFIVHPWIRRMLIFAAKESKFLEFSSDGTASPVNNPRRAFSCEGKENDLLTVFNVTEKYLRIKSDWLSKLKKVGVVQLGRWRNNPKYHIEVENQDELLHGLGHQNHLKYLSLRGISRIEALPDSIANLFSLEILDLRACHNLERLPPAVAALRNLTHLDVSECYLLESMPKGLEYLSSLQVLKGFVIGKEWKYSCKISDLSGELKKLRKLSIRVGSNDNGAQAQLSQLNDSGFPALQILTISWGVISSEQTPFKFPEILRKLDLRCAPNRMLPENLPKLEKLYITGGDISNYFRTAPKGLEAVKFVRFKYLKSWDIDEPKLASLFPNCPHVEVIKGGVSFVEDRR